MKGPLESSHLLDNPLMIWPIAAYIEDITWPRGDTKFLFECWKIFHEWAQRTIEINTNEIPNHFILIVFWCERRDLLCSHSKGDIYTCEDNMLFSRVKISRFARKLTWYFIAVYIIIIFLYFNFYVEPWDRGTFFKWPLNKGSVAGEFTDNFVHPSNQPLNKGRLGDMGWRETF